jgi:hypothetical protein
MGEVLEEELLLGFEPKPLRALSIPRAPEEQRADIVEALDPGQVPGVARGEARELTAQRARAGLERANVPRPADPDDARAIRAQLGVDLGIADPLGRGLGHRLLPGVRCRRAGLLPLLSRVRLAN